MPTEAWEIVEREWNLVHAGDGHAPCTAREAGRARIRTEARELRERKKREETQQ